MCQACNSPDNRGVGEATVPGYLQGIYFYILKLRNMTKSFHLPSSALRVLSLDGQGWAGPAPRASSLLVIN